MIDETTLAALIAVALGGVRVMEVLARAATDRFRRRNGNGQSVGEQQLAVLREILAEQRKHSAQIVVVERKVGGLYGRLDVAVADSRQAHEKIEDKLADLRVTVAESRAS